MRQKPKSIAARKQTKKLNGIGQFSMNGKGRKKLHFHCSFESPYRFIVIIKIVAFGDISLKLLVGSKCSFHCVYTFEREWMLICLNRPKNSKHDEDENRTINDHAINQAPCISNAPIRLISRNLLQFIRFVFIKSYSDARSIGNLSLIKGSNIKMQINDEDTTEGHKGKKKQE